MVTADERWRAAVAWVRDHYPEDVFPADSATPDAVSARFARRLCDLIVERAGRCPECNATMRPAADGMVCPTLRLAALADRHASTEDSQPHSP